MAYWTPPFRDSKHAPMAGTAGFCYADNQLCGGEDTAGQAIVCLCCQAAAATSPAVPSPAGSPDVPIGEPAQPSPAQPVLTDQPQTAGEQSVQQAGQEGMAEPGSDALADPAWPNRPPEVPV